MDDLEREEVIKIFHSLCNFYRMGGSSTHWNMGEGRGIKVMKEAIETYRLLRTEGTQ